MYFPDLESVKKCVVMMATHQKEENKYRGIIPKTEEELPLARKQLGQYFRTVWKDTIQAMEVELAVTKENYYEKINSGLQMSMLNRVFNNLSSHEKDNLRGLGIPSPDEYFVE